MALATAAAPAAAQEATFRWRDLVRCGPDGTLQFAAGALLVLPDTPDGIFEFRGQAREASRRGEEYVLTLTFFDADDRVLFEMASEPFEMDPNRVSQFIVFGEDPRIADYWAEIDSVELDAQVPLEPLFEDALDFYGFVLPYARDQELEARTFGE